MNAYYSFGYIVLASICFTMKSILIKEGGIGFILFSCLFCVLGCLAIFESALQLVLYFLGA